MFCIGAEPLVLGTCAAKLTENILKHNRNAKKNSVKKLVYVHITPPLTNKATEELYLKDVSDIFDGEIILGRDRMKFRLKSKF